MSTYYEKELKNFEQGMQRNLEKFKNEQQKKLEQLEKQYKESLKEKYKIVINGVVRKAKYKNISKKKANYFHVPLENVIGYGNIVEAYRKNFGKNFNYKMFNDIDTFIIKEIICSMFKEKFDSMEEMDIIDISTNGSSYRGEKIYFVDYDENNNKIIVPREFKYDCYGYPPIKFLKRVPIDYFTMGNVYWHSDQEFYDEIVKEST